MELLFAIVCWFPDLTEPTLSGDGARTSKDDSKLRQRLLDSSCWWAYWLWTFFLPTSAKAISITWMTAFSSSVQGLRLVGKSEFTSFLCAYVYMTSLGGLEQAEVRDVSRTQSGLPEEAAEFNEKRKNRKWNACGQFTHTGMWLVHICMYTDQSVGFFALGNYLLQTVKILPIWLSQIFTCCRMLVDCLDTISDWFPHLNVCFVVFCYVECRLQSK